MPKPVKPLQAGPLVAQMGRLFGKALGEAVAPLGLAPAPFLVLRELWKRDGQTQSALARRLEVEQATMANTLKRMERDGLIVRAPNPDDKRSQLIRLTARAAALEKPAKAASKQVNTVAFASLSRKERKRFVELASRIASALAGQSTETQAAQEASIEAPPTEQP